MEKIIEILNKYSKTKLEWIVGFHGKNCRVIDPMDYHKIADELIMFKKQTEKELSLKDELIAFGKWFNKCGQPLILPTIDEYLQSRPDSKDDEDLESLLTHDKVTIAKWYLDLVKRSKTVTDDK